MRGNPFPILGLLALILLGAVVREALRRPQDAPGRIEDSGTTFAPKDASEAASGP